MVGLDACNRYHDEQPEWSLRSISGHAPQHRSHDQSVCTTSDDHLSDVDWANTHTDEYIITSDSNRHTFGDQHTDGNAYEDAYRNTDIAAI